MTHSFWTSPKNLAKMHTSDSCTFGTFGAQILVSKLASEKQWKTVKKPVKNQWKTVKNTGFSNLQNWAKIPKSTVNPESWILKIWGKKRQNRRISKCTQAIRTFFGTLALWHFGTGDFQSMIYVRFLPSMIYVQRFLVPTIYEQRFLTTPQISTHATDFHTPQISTLQHNYLLSVHQFVSNWFVLHVMQQCMTHFIPILLCP